MEGIRSEKSYDGKVSMIKNHTVENSQRTKF